MKRIIVYTAVVFLLMSVVSCKKEMMDYQGTEGIYFAVQHGGEFFDEKTWPYQPYSLVEFVRINQDEAIIPIKVRITGPTKDYDRPFRVEVNPDSTTAILGIHYEALSGLVIPANAIEAVISIRLKRSPDLKEEERTLGLRLIANEHFELSFPEWDALPELTNGIIVSKFDASLHKLYINDIMVEPEVWVGSIQDGNRESGLMGEFTQKKMELLTELFGLTYEDFSSTETMPMVRNLLIASDAGAYLVERYNAGDPVLEEDGRLMYMGSVPWTSYLGVPWVPGS